MKDWLTSTTVTKNIQGEDVEFRRIPVGLFQKCRTLNESVSKAMAMLFKDTTKDVEINQVSVPSDVEGQMSTEYKQSAIQPAIASMRATQMEQGIKGIIDAITSEATMDVLSEIIVTSAYKTFSKDDAHRIKDEMDVATMIVFLKGAFEASAGDYAKLGKSLFQKNAKLQDVADQVKQAMTP
jgi:hypothetical protein